MSAVTLRDVTFTYPGATAPTLRHVNLDVAEGEFLAVMGANGCGKSTLCKTMNGLIPQFIVGDLEGEITVAGVDVSGAQIGELAQHIGYVYQDFENQIVRPTVIDEASFSCLNFAYDDYAERGMRALELCGLADRAESYIWQLSGGQKHLLALAGAIALEPDVIVLDEPVAQLDPYHADQTYRVLRELNERYGKTIIVIEHHTDFIAEYCTTAALMVDGGIAWKLPAHEALRRIDDLAASDVHPPQIALAARELVRAGALPEDTVLPTTVDEGATAFWGVPFVPRVREHAPASTAEPAVSFRGVDVSYRSVKGAPRQVFHGLDLDIHRGEKVALVGANGAGKSTLMKLMCGLIKPQAGEVLLEGVRTRDIGPDELSDKISLVYQNPEQMFIKDSIRADVEFAMRARGVEDAAERAAALLERFRLTEFAERDGRLLSGGQMRRASLAVGIALDPPILLLDEPTANLDIGTRQEITKLVSDLRGVTDTVIIATHDMQLVCQFAERVIVLTGGEVIGDAAPDEVFMDEDVVERSGIRPPEIFQMGRALDCRAACYTLDEFLVCFPAWEAVQGEKDVGEVMCA
ncbi:ATP-binding cassette domain-containing protein [Olsenella sp. DSM 107455]|uniref:ATP-binding cassette domain-containing protein n=1 Tax=Thermophilibacter gallinarum TaxID=2779357 RepID=A0ABR9QRR4_9ACTN|nr:ATP-binding cassette domain-containing protein [Thermophilibacter gallinarum]